MTTSRVGGMPIGARDRFATAATRADKPTTTTTSVSSSCSENGLIVRIVIPFETCFAIFRVSRAYGYRPVTARPRPRYGFRKLSRRL